MAAVEATLYSILANGSLRDVYRIQFPSTSHEEHSYYVHETELLGSEPTFYVSRRPRPQPHVAILRKLPLLTIIPYHLLKVASDVGPNCVQLEACTSSICVKSSGWGPEPSDKSYLQLPPSTPTRQILHLLRPDESFKVGDRELVLQANYLPYVSIDNDVQVRSSRPSSFHDEGVPEADVQGTDPQPGNQPATPIHASGAAVMETPVTNRYEPRSKVPRFLADCIEEEMIKGKEDSRALSTESPKQDPTSPLPNITRRHRRSFSTRDSEGFDPSPAKTLVPSLSQDVPISEDGSSANDRGAPSEARINEQDPDLNRPSHVGHDDDPVLPELGTVVLGSVPLDTADKPGSSQTTQSSGDKSIASGASQKDNSALSEVSNNPRISCQTGPGRNNPRKRSINPGLGVTKAGLSDESRSVGDLPSVFEGNNESTQGEPRKRQKVLASNRAAVSNAESQDSVRSTIHVDIPRMPQAADPDVQLALSPVHEVDQSQESPNKSSLPRDIDSTPRSSVKSTEPPSSSVKSARSTGQKRVLRVVYASSTKIDEATVYTRFLRQQNVKQVKNVKDCDILCVGKGELKRTFNLILAILKGKQIVTDEWIVQSMKQDHMLETAGFIPDDPAGWGTSVVDAIDRGRRESKPMQGWTINFTPSAKKELGKSWSELKELCLIAGAAVQAMIPRKSPEASDPTIVVAASHEPDSVTLEERGWRVFNKDIITYSIIRGHVDASSDEFLVKPAKENLSGKKKRR
ncbi:MAG: hypothetical protein Q9201_001871 [Fulgogasparrea decipioides]